MLQDRVEHRRQILHLAALLLRVIDEGRDALLRGGVDHRELELRIVRAELDEQIEHLVDDLFGALFGPIDLVDDEDRAQAVGERLAQHEARLRHHAFVGIAEQQRRVGHAEHALDLAAEVGVAGGVDELDAHALVFDRGALRLDRDAALALDVAGVHHALGDGLVGAERAAGAQQTVDEGRLAVVDVGDDGDVAQVFSGGDRGHHDSRLGGCRVGWAGCREQAHHRSADERPDRKCFAVLPRGDDGSRRDRKEPFERRRGSVSGDQPSVHGVHGR
jgi:hypothetical protein